MWTQSVVVVMRNIKQFLLWIVCISSSKEYKRVSVLDTVSSSSNEDYKTVSVLDTVSSSSNVDYKRICFAHSQ
jgi:hypothetical protein